MSKLGTYSELRFTRNVKLKGTEKNCGNQQI